MPRALFLVPLVVFLALAVYFAYGLTRDPRKLPSTLKDKPAPQFALPLLEGEGELTTADLASGQVKLVNIFASWCVPCRVEHPLLMRVSGQGLPVYGINWKDTRENAKNWLQEFGDPYAKIGFDPNNKAGVEWGVYGIPETYVIDKQGRVRYKHVGPILPEHWNETIQPLIEELHRAG